MSRQYMYCRSFQKLAYILYAFLICFTKLYAANIFSYYPHMQPYVFVYGMMQITIVILNLHPPSPTSKSILWWLYYLFHIMI